MTHKCSFFVADLIRPDLGIPDMVQEILDLLLCGDLPDLISLDEWWEAIVQRRRQEVKSNLADEFGLICECCSIAPPTDLHEVFIRRSADMTWEQIKLFSRANCALVCRSCHGSGLADTDEFKERISKRRAT